MHRQQACRTARHCPPLFLIRLRAATKYHNISDHKSPVLIGQRGWLLPGPPIRFILTFFVASAACCAPLVLLQARQMAVSAQSSYSSPTSVDTPSKPPRAASEQYLRLLVCVAGIYVCFLSWGLLQERISTRAYTATVDGMIVSSRFPSFFALNIVQASIAALLAWAALSFPGRQEAHGSISLLAIWHNPRLFWSYIRLSLSSCLASPFGYAALAHITYPTMILGKSCKLVPVMLVSVLLHGRRYPPVKYFTVALITAGVSIFMLFDGSHPQKGSGSNSLLGITLLLVNLFLDGLTNSWQDELFRRYRVRSQHLMFYMNLFSSLFMSSYLITRHILSLFLQNSNTSEVARFVDFIRLHPACLVDMFLFGLLGAAGQLFIFHTIEHFGAVLLVTVTVTRKLATMLVSVACFGHSVRWQQAVGIGAVFASLAIDSFAHQHKSPS